MPTEEDQLLDILQEPGPLTPPLSEHPAFQGDQRLDASYLEMRERFSRFLQGIRDGEGQGTMDLDFDALGDGSEADPLAGIDTRAFAVLRGLGDAYKRGNIDQAAAIRSLMNEFGLSYDEAEQYLLSNWGGTASAGQDDSPYSLDDLLAEMFGGGGGGGGGGGAAPVFTPPDRGLVEDYVKSRLVALVGRADEGRIKILTDLYLKDAKAAFGGASVEPKQSITEKIRSFDDYKRIHKYRPDAADEDTWISGQMSQLMNAGMQAGEAEKLAIDFAQTGVAQAEAGEMSEARRIGQQPTKQLPGFFQQMRYATQVAARSVR